MRELEAGIFFNEQTDEIVSVGLVCPICKTVLKQSGFGMVCIEPKCKCFGFNPFILHEVVTISTVKK